MYVDWNKFVLTVDGNIIIIQRVATHCLLSHVAFEYILIGLRLEEDVIAVIKIKTIMKDWRQLSDEDIKDYEFEDWYEE